MSPMKKTLAVYSASLVTMDDKNMGVGGGGINKMNRKSELILIFQLL